MTTKTPAGSANTAMTRDINATRYAYVLVCRAVALLVLTTGACVLLPRQCFNYRHDHFPKRAHHEAVLLVSLCIECEKRAVQWRCDFCEETYCTICFKNTHRKGTLRLHTYTVLPYYPADLGAEQVRPARVADATDVKPHTLTVWRVRHTCVTNSGRWTRRRSCASNSERRPTARKCGGRQGWKRRPPASSTPCACG